MLIRMMKGMVKKYGWKFLIFGGIGKLISLTIFVGILGHWYGGLLNNEEGVATIYLTPGSTTEEMLAEVDSAVTRAGGHGDRLARLLWVRGWDERLKVGKYELRGSLSIGEAAEMLVTGKRIEVKVVVPSSRDLSIIAGRIASPIYADSAEILKLIEPDSIRWQIIPNTYNMYWETDAEGSVDRLLKESAKWWTEERIAKAKSKGLTPEEAVILASIVQAETKTLSEAPIVAGLYLNRLEIGQALQADPTVIYAVGDATIRRVLREHLSFESPYNTYMHTGLPPGTIRTPEPTFIEAVLNAKEHNYLYMCAEPGRTGKHSFAVKFKVHQRNARKFQRWLNSENIYN